MEDLTFATATTLADKIARRQVSAVELVDAYLEKIAAYNGPVNAIVTLDDSGARRRAIEADIALVQGESWGPLHGVPFTLKDAHLTTGVRSTYGHPDYMENVPSPDGPVSSRLKRAGGILIGKTHLDLFPGNPLGQCNNPWDLQRATGGSSSGSAAAVAAGLTPFDIGTDAGGSILQPAHYCGIFGMRPTEHRVSADGLTLLEPVFIWHVLMTPGPMTRSPEDLDLLMRVLSGPEGRDYNVPPLPWRDSPTLSISELKIAWSPLGAALDDSIRNTLNGFVQDLQDLGAAVEQVLPDVDLAECAQVGDLLFDQLVTAFEDRSEQNDHPLALRDYLFALGRRSELISVWERFFDEWDVLVCPASAVAAPLHDNAEVPVLSTGRVLTRVEWTIPVRLAPGIDHPSVVIPVGHDGDGMPIGLQLIGRRWTDERLAAIAGAFSEVTGGFKAPSLSWRS